ncbi:hypothetical protein H8D85_01185 [bacterium]|nr:hypothetical protein [bacterium]
MTTSTNKHLGGHANITHIDTGALLYFKESIKLSTMLDIGCGPGGMLKEASNHNIFAEGIDGLPGPHRHSDVNIFIHDFCNGPFNHKMKYDLGWSCEFLEHVEEKYIPNYMPSFQSCAYIAITYAPKGKGGHHHVNCKDFGYWVETFNKYNFDLLEDMTKNLRTSSSMTRNFVRSTGLMFKNKEM